jgi:predicted nucleotidyltransferase
LIGSFARNEQTDESDIDLFVVSKPDEQRRISQIATMIEWEYEIPVQIVTPDDIANFPPEAILIYARPLKNSKA